MRDPIQRAAEWGVEHPRAYRAIAVTIIGLSLILQANVVFSDRPLWWRICMFVLATTTAAALAVMALNWYRLDALDDIREDIVDRTGESMLGDYAWLILYNTASTRDLYEIRRWMPHHDLTTVPLAEMPARLALLVDEMLAGAPGFFEHHE